MKTPEIVDKLENIVTDVIPDSDKWQNQSVKDFVVKYKVCLATYSVLKIIMILLYFLPLWQLGMTKKWG